MNWVDHFDGRSFIYEDDHSTITIEYAIEPQEANMHGYSSPLPQPSPRSNDANDNIRAWLDGVIAEDESKPLVTDVLHALSGLQHSAAHSPGGNHPNYHHHGQGKTVVNVQTMGSGFIGRAPPVASTEFFANMVVVAILLLFAPGFTLLAAGVFVTSRVAERWAGHD